MADTGNRYPFYRTYSSFCTERLKNPGPDPWPRPGMARCGDAKWGIHNQWKQLYTHIPSRQGRLACQDGVMESQAFISTANNCISTPRRARASWLARTEFNSVCFRSITVTTPLCRVSMQVAQWRNWMRSYGRYRYDRGFKIRDQQDDKKYHV